MKTMSAKEAKDGFGLLLDTAQREPVTITKKGREVAVLVSKADFERLEALEDAYWGHLAEEARKEGLSVWRRARSS
jgi:prevent-host-death family protein